MSDGEIVAKPENGWTKLVVYRPDLFKATVLDAPTSLDSIRRELAENTDSAPSSRPPPPVGASWATMRHLGLTEDANTDPAQKFVMSGGKSA